MSISLKPYPEYKDSGLPWLGDIPAHWEVRRFKYILHEINARSQDGQEQLLSVSQYTGVTPRRSRNGDDEPDTRAASLVGYKMVCPDDLVVNIMLAWNGSLGVSRFAGIVSPAYCVYRFNDQGEPWYFHNLLRLPLYKGRIKVDSTGVVDSRLRLYTDDLYNVEAIVPPSEEQAAVARFVAVFGRQVDCLIRAKRRIIELLNEQKQAIIHRAVTRGLDSNVRLRPSGIDWLGDVPEHWAVRRVKQTSQILRGKFTHRPRNEPSLYDGPYPFIQTGDVARALKTITAYRQTLNDRGLAVSKMFPAGTLVMTIAANIGDVAVLDFEACFPDSIVGFVPRDGIVRDYLYYAFRAMRPELLREAPVNTQGNLNVDRIGSRGMVLPPLDEQQEIVLYIEEGTRALNITIDRARRGIDLLREYRTRLIADVVTGKLDVRGVRLPVPDEIEGPDDVDAGEKAEVKESDEIEESAV
jgi:type I restriction enzyme S subunit